MRCTKKWSLTPQHVSLPESLTSQHAPNYTQAEAICHLGDLTVHPSSRLPDGEGEEESKPFNLLG